jgi:hypothetical protein
MFLNEPTTTPSCVGRDTAVSMPADLPHHPPVSGDQDRGGGVPSEEAKGLKWKQGGKSQTMIISNLLYRLSRASRS